MSSISTTRFSRSSYIIRNCLLFKRLTAPEGAIAHALLKSPSAVASNSVVGYAECDSASPHAQVGGAYKGRTQVPPTAPWKPLRVQYFAQRGSPPHRKYFTAQRTASQKSKVNPSAPSLVSSTEAEKRGMRGGLQYGGDLRIVPPLRLRA